MIDFDFTPREGDVAENVVVAARDYLRCLSCPALFRERYGCCEEEVCLDCL